MSGYIGVLPRSSVDRILEQLFEKFRDNKQFQDVLRNENIQEHIKEQVFSAIDSQQLKVSALRDEDFSKNFILAFMAVYIVQKYCENKSEMPQFDLGVLFKKELDDPLEYQHLLTELLKVILTNRNNLLPPEKQLSEDQINSLAEKLTNSDNFKQNFIFMLNLLAKENILQKQFNPQPSPKNKVLKEDAMGIVKERYSARLENKAGVLGVTHIPIEELQITGVTGTITSDQGLPFDIISSQRVSELEAKAGKIDPFSELTDMAKEIVAGEAHRARLTH